MKKVIALLRKELTESRVLLKASISIDKQWTKELDGHKLPLSHKWLRQDIRRLEKIISELMEAIEILKPPQNK